MSVIKKNSISIVTVTKDPNLKWFENTLKSVFEQNEYIIEHIILDASEEELVPQIKQKCSKYGVKYYKQSSQGLWEAFSEAYSILGILGMFRLWGTGMVMGLRRLGCIASRTGSCICATATPRGLPM